MIEMFDYYRIKELLQLNCTDNFTVNYTDGSKDVYVKNTDSGYLYFKYKFDANTTYNRLEFLSVTYISDHGYKQKVDEILTSVYNDDAPYICNVEQVVFGGTKNERT
jgi:hypothetical protein